MEDNRAHSKKGEQPMAYQPEEGIWAEILVHVGNQVEIGVIENWFSHVLLDRIDGDTVVLKVPNEFFLNWFQLQYGELLRKVVSKLFQREMEIQYIVSDEVKSKPEPIRRYAERPTPPRQSIESEFLRRLNPNYTFENFVVGQGNEFAFAAAKAVTENPGRNYNPLFIYGLTGLGKTHLMQGIGHRLLRMNPQAKVMYVTSEEFTNDLIRSISEGSQVRFRDKYRKVDVLLIDDIHFIADKEATQIEFFHTFNELFDQHKQIVLSSDRSPKEIRGVETRLVSRFEWGLVVDIQPPDFETRVAILKSKLAHKNIQLSEEILAFIAQSVTSNVRQLEGALTGVIALMKLKGNGTITLEQVEEVIRNLEDRDKIGSITPEAILKAVAETYDVRIADLKGRCRKKQYVLPRQVGMYLCRQLLPDCSLSYIGEYFGGKDHTTVLHACERVEEEMKKKGETFHIVESLIKKLKEKK